MFQKRRVDGKAVVMLALLGMGVLSSTGCTAVTGLTNLFKYNNDLNEYIMSSRAYSMSGKAWHARKHCFVDQKYLKDFQRVFVRATCRSQTAVAVARQLSHLWNIGTGATNRPRVKHALPLGLLDSLMEPRLPRRKGWVCGTKSKHRPPFKSSTSNTT